MDRGDTRTFSPQQLLFISKEPRGYSPIILSAILSGNLIAVLR